MSGYAILLVIYLASSIPPLLVLIYTVRVLKGLSARSRLILIPLCITLLLTPMMFPFYRGILFMASGLAVAMMLYTDGGAGVVYLLSQRDLKTWNISALIGVAVATYLIGVVLAASNNRWRGP